MSGRGSLRLVPALTATPSANTEALLKEWAAWMRAAGSSEMTIRTRTYGVQLLCKRVGVEDATALEARHIVLWLGACNSPWTRSTYASSARAWHRWLVSQGYRDDDPMERVPVPKAPRGVPRPASTEALRDVLDGAPRKVRAYMVLAAFEGLRVHEIAKVRGEDFADGWFHVVGKGGVGAALPIHPLVEQLRRGFPASGFWFPGSVDGHVDRQTVTKAITAAFRRQGYHVTAHQLRHWFGTHTQRMGKDVRVTQELMRHASLASTQIYTEVSSPSKVDAVNRLGL